MNLEFNSVCRRKKHSLFHWNTLMLPGPIMLIWMWCKKNGWMIIGTSTRTEVCQILGKDSQNSIYWKRNLLKGYMWFGRRLTQVQATTGPDKVLPEVCAQIGKAAKKRKKTRIGKPRSQNSLILDEREASTKLVRRVRNTKKSWRMRGENWKCMWTRLCRAKREQTTRPTSYNVPKTKHAWKVEAHESTRQRVEPSRRKIHEDHIAGKGFTSVTHHNLVQKFIPVSQAMKIPDAKAAVDKGWKKLETVPAWQLDKVKSKKEVILEAQRHKESPLCHIDGHMSSKKCGMKYNQSSKNTED